MKAAAFGYARAATLADALALLGAEGARPLAGSQSLGPMLNLRLARPTAVVDLRRLPELRGAAEAAEAVTWGAATTHAEVEDGAVPDPTGGFLQGVARTIAYRAVRNRGTVGGSLCHADPAADWPGALALVGAEAEVATTVARRRIPLAAFVRAPFETALDPGEVLVAIRIPRPPAGSRHARHKVVRKTGEFAQAIAAVRTGPPEVLRIVLGAVDGPPLVFDGPGALAAARDAIPALTVVPPYRRAMLHAALDRAATEAA